MASLTNYAVQQLNLEMKDGSGTIPTTFYAALMKTSPALDGTGGVEVDSGVNTWYARIAATMDTVSLSGRSLSNTSAILFTASAADAVSGNIVSLCIFDALTSGNCWFILPLTTQMAIGIGSLVNFPIGQAVVEFTTT